MGLLCPEKRFQLLGFFLLATTAYLMGIMTKDGFNELRVFFSPILAI